MAMQYDQVVNATSSFNVNYCNGILKPAFESKIGEDVCFFYQSNQFRTYPSVQVQHYIVGQWEQKSREFKNEIAFHITVRGNQDRIAWQLISEFFNTTKLTPNNVLMHQKIDLYNWSDPNNPVKYGCMRLLLRSGQGFSLYVDPMDDEIRHYRIDLDLFYK